MISFVSPLFPSPQLAKPQAHQRLLQFCGEKFDAVVSRDDTLRAILTPFMKTPITFLQVNNDFFKVVIKGNDYLLKAQNMGFVLEPDAGDDQKNNKLMQIDYSAAENRKKPTTITVSIQGKAVAKFTHTEKKGTPLSAFQQQVMKYCRDLRLHSNLYKNQIFSGTPSNNTFTFKVT